MRNNYWLGTLAVLGVFGYTAVSAYAQQAPTAGAPTAPAAGAPKAGGKRPNVQAALLKELNLTADQKAKIKTISDKAKADRKAIRDDAKLTDAQKKDKAKEIGKEATKAIREVLTPEQQAKFEEGMKKARAKGAGKAGKKGPGAQASAGAPAAKP